MLRRRCLQLAGVALGLGAAGCSGDGSTADQTDTPHEGQRRGGDESGGTPANEFDYATTVTDGVAVPLVPVADAIKWFQDEDAVFADARSRTAYEKAHVTDAAFSPAPDGQQQGDPIEERPTDTRIVTYCGCPHHLSSMRAASLIDAGYANTYALDEGFQAWYDRGHPVEGSAIDTEAPKYSITGRLADPGADAWVWAWHDPSGQREVAPVEPDGRFTLQLHFYDLTPDSPIRLVGPEREVTKPIEELTGTTVTL
jgi:rhodanese-related sulfurtransferase